ncbi:uncharacterized protein LOC105182558 isoform X2 [Harpegnathos saltator]|uniref:uncharacterized protein LOC105182558 isoform X2 n=1 Tax=Harpegnathos saltator TaxID=610380 RepID=UPI00058EF9AD|nr:uncharacterized protein LOC105182558 isoform X2 [Harpegnathos saltator]
MSTATPRRPRRIRDPTHTMHARLRLTAIPADLLPGVSRTMDIPSVENLLNRRPDGWTSPQSPDELVIQKRGRRRSIVWSPDLDANKRNNLLSLSSRERTPVKSPQASRDILKSTPRKRLSLIDICQSEFTTPEKKRKTYSLMAEVNTSQTQPIDDLMNGLQGLSHEQLKMPVADIQQLIQKLRVLRQNIYASLICSNEDNSAYNRAYIHLNTFEKTLIDQGRTLQDSQHWISLVHYALAAWEITKELPEWENQGHHNTTRKCFKSLSQFCAEAIRRGNFEISDLETYIARFKTISEECEEFKICLQIAKEAKQES